MGWERRREGGGEEQTVGERKEWDLRERSFIFSLEFPTIEPSDPDEQRDKVAPHGKDYAWVPVLWSFDNFGR